MLGIPLVLSSCKCFRRSRSYWLQRTDCGTLGYFWPRARNGAVYRGPHWAAPVQLCKCSSLAKHQRRHDMQHPRRAVPCLNLPEIALVLLIESHRGISNWNELKSCIVMEPEPYRMIAPEVPRTIQNQSEGKIGETYQKNSKGVLRF